MREEFFTDNRRVKQGRDYAEFLAVAIKTVPGDEYPSPYEMRISRYTCPGRCDSYSFALMPDGKIIFWTEQNMTLPEAIKLVQQDLDRPQVVSMLERMKGMKVFRRIGVSLIEPLAPRSKSIRLIRKLLTPERR